MASPDVATTPPGTNTPDFQYAENQVMNALRMLMFRRDQVTNAADVARPRQEKHGGYMSRVGKVDITWWGASWAREPRTYYTNSIGPEFVSECFLPIFGNVV